MNNKRSYTQSGLFMFFIHKFNTKLCFPSEVVSCIYLPLQSSLERCHYWNSYDPYLDQKTFAVDGIEHFNYFIFAVERGGIKSALFEERLDRISDPFEILFCVFRTPQFFNVGARWRCDRFTVSIALVLGKIASRKAA